MQSFTRNSQALVSSLWGLMVIVSLVILLAITANSQPADSGWPRTIQSNGTRIEVFQPQVENWDKGKLQERVAVVVTDRSSGQSIYGAAWASAKTIVNQQTRLVTLYDVEVNKVTFPSAGSKEPEYVDKVTQALQHWNMTIALDRLLADMAITQAEKKAAGDTLNSTPPKILVREDPAVLILIDGQPVMQKVPDSNLMRVTNTPAMMVLDSGPGRYFLRGDGYWVTASNVLGPWQLASNPPSSLGALLEPAEQAHIVSPSTIPEIIVSTEPAELIQLTGEVQLSPIEGTRLLYVTNTDSDLFMNMPQQRYFVVLAGRWYSASALDGPWEFVEGSALPLDFARIPAGHPKSAVLASVPGTPEAEDAVVAAQVPQTATVDRKKASFNATYDGEPQFKRIGNTDMSYAVNSPDDILLVGGKYYAVSNGVWFVAAGPSGPWAVADFVPPEVYTIPPEVPVYHVKYVYVYDSTPDYVYVGYTPGYFGAFIWNGAIVYGTGYYYAPWCVNYYYSWPWTWGFGFRYGYWGGGFFWRPWYPRPWYGHRWPREPVHSLWWNSRMMYNRSLQRAVTQANLSRPMTVYQRWREPGVVSSHPVPLRTPGGIRPAPRSQVFARPSMRGRPDVYAGRNGQIYSRQNNSWYRQDRGTWQKLPPQARPAQPAPQAPTNPRVYQDLERERQARIQGQNRVQQYQKIRPPARSMSPPPHISAPAPRMSAPPRTAAPRTAAPRTTAPPRSAAPRSGRRHR
ncbi:MAG: hypothetical protein LAO78_21390 [Acidobacteriia bacterium]|nr:hypothetical protein [Terriglobia bacterium]